MNNIASKSKESQLVCIAIELVNRIMVVAQLQPETTKNNYLAEIYGLAKEWNATFCDMYLPLPKRGSL